jgi:hypothetical protein
LDPPKIPPRGLTKTYLVNRNIDLRHLHGPPSVESEPPSIGGRLTDFNAGAPKGSKKPNPGLF